MGDFTDAYPAVQASNGAIPQVVTTGSIAVDPGYMGYSSVCPNLNDELRLARDDRMRLEGLIQNLTLEFQALLKAHTNLQQKYEHLRDLVALSLPEVPPDMTPGTWITPPGENDPWWRCSCNYDHKGIIPTCAMCGNCRPAPHK
jgi:hypothetical protein